MQPPPRGCVLKLPIIVMVPYFKRAAASARLCVETLQNNACIKICIAAASARLCVETQHYRQTAHYARAAASARLCVETIGLPLSS